MSQMQRTVASDDPLSQVNQPAAPVAQVQSSPQRILRRETDVPIRLLPGEHLLIPDRNFIECTFFLSTGMNSQGRAVLTNYRISLIPLDIRFCRDNRIRNEYLEIPLQLISKAEQVSDKIFTSIDIATKDGRSVRVNFVYSQEIFYILTQTIFPTELSRIFAFELVPNVDDFGWNMYDPIQEYAYFGITEDSSPWRIIDNRNGQLCATYPELVVCHHEFPPARISALALFRTKNRFPALTYVGSSGGSIWRCSQPRTGVTFQRNAEDESLIREIRLASPSQQLCIFDARPYSSAQGNRVRGGGVESKSSYDNVEIYFCYIDNIHAVRDSYKVIMSTPANKFFAGVEKSGWMVHIQNILKGAIQIREFLKLGYPCLVHCTDGWDRTSQLCALAQMMVDARYRTIKGFISLIEKDWISFGHQFAKRSGHCQKVDSQCAPIFIQFLDCVHQLLAQFPTSFEFNEKLLLEMAHHIYSCRFGTFLTNCPQASLAFGTRNRTMSFWTYIINQIDQIRNPFYEEFQDNDVVPHNTIRRLEFWHAYFSQWNPDFFYESPNIFSPSEHMEILMRNATEGMTMYKRLLTEKEEQLISAKRGVEEGKGYEFTD